jgi:hypothetical protein
MLPFACRQRTGVSEGRYLRSRLDMSPDSMGEIKKHAAMPSAACPPLQSGFYDGGRLGAAAGQSAG